MNFPQTRLTLIERLAGDGSEEDWRGFLKDYWGPVCRFALRCGARDLDEAEEVASQVFETLWKNRLLNRWVSNQAEKLRSLLCAVARNILANRSRADARWTRLQSGLARRVDESNLSDDQNADVFYAAWAEDLIGQAVESLAVECCRKNQGDRIRVLYGRLCEGLSIAEVAAALELAPSTVDYYYRNARDRLAGLLEELLYPQVARYCGSGDLKDEFAREWEHLGRHLAAHGGLDEAVRRSYAKLPRRARAKPVWGRMGETVRRMTSIHPPDIDTNDSE